MARNAEKAMTALARWTKMKEEEEKGPKLRRPNRTEDCSDPKLAEKWRREIISDVAKKITQIQNPGLGEFKIRDLNDEINKLLRLKYQWEVRIKELGGPDFKRIAPKMLDHEGREVPGNRGYKYFGAAKDLPGVRELFEKIPSEKPKKTRAQLMRHIDADYYGYMDDEDGLLIPLEEAAEQKAILEAEKQWVKVKAGASDQTEPDDSDDDDDIYQVAEEEEEGEPLATKVEVDSHGHIKYIAQVDVPTQDEIEKAIIERKKNELLDKYASESLDYQFQEAKVLMGIESEVNNSGSESAQEKAIDME